MSNYITLYTNKKKLLCWLLEGHQSELATYKGVMISKENASKDMFKIDLLNMLQNNK